jgi:hypothetical protein
MFNLARIKTQMVITELVLKARKYSLTLVAYRVVFQVLLQQVELFPFTLKTTSKTLRTTEVLPIYSKEIHQLLKRV